MAKASSPRTKRQKPGLPTPHTAALDSADVATSRYERRFFLPEAGRSVRADDITEVTAPKPKKSKQESGDGE